MSRTRVLEPWTLSTEVHSSHLQLPYLVPFCWISHPQASNPLYKQPVSTHFVETDFNMYGKSYNGGVHWSLCTGGGRTGPTNRSLEDGPRRTADWTLIPLHGSHPKAEVKWTRLCPRGNLWPFHLYGGDSSLAQSVMGLFFFFFICVFQWQRRRSREEQRMNSSGLFRERGRESRVCLQFHNINKLSHENLNSHHMKHTFSLCTEQAGRWFIFVYF